PSHLPHPHKILRLTHRNVAAGSFQIRPSGNSSRANVSPAAVQGSVRGDVACVDVPPGGKGGQVPGNIKDLDVPALGFQPRNRTPGETSRTPTRPIRPAEMLPPCVFSNAVPPISPVVISPAPVLTSTL